MTTQLARSYRADFYPRPPGGGRPVITVAPLLDTDFYPRPPGGGRLFRDDFLALAINISIHALRGEGDGCTINANCPSDDISIHALRVEGDRFNRL